MSTAWIKKKAGYWKSTVTRKTSHCLFLSLQASSHVWIPPYNTAVFYAIRSHS